MSRSSSSRRAFLKTIAVASSAAWAVPYFTSSSFARDESANDRLNVAAIGTSIYTNRYTGEGEHGGRGADIGHQAGVLGNMLAVADVNLRHARFFAKDYDRPLDMYQDYRRLLDRKDIDAVTIGTPDHWHVKIAVDALRAGKHVYCEKPLTLTVAEGQLACRVAKETGLVFQVGTQQRSEFDANFLKAVVLTRSGRLGDNLQALSSVGQGEQGGPFENSDPPEELDWDFWLGQAPRVPYCKPRCDYDFRWWLEYSGGQVTDWGVHHTDIACWALGLDDTGPYEIEGQGTFPQIENGYNVAVDFDCTMKFAGNKSIRLLSGTNELLISGDQGRIRVNRGGLTGKPVEDLTPEDDVWIQEEIVKLCHGKQPGNHMRNFFECVKEGGMPISDVWSHHRSVSVCHLANIAMRLGRKLNFDPDREDFIGDAEASAMLSRPQRPEYAVT
jgi:myo-inositol 2-dehydrogenase / D-chiro-inositol 1-dehydrogenase